MSAIASLAYTYHYPFASNLVQRGSGAGLRLATSGDAEPCPHFFRGRLEHPKETADQLLTLAQVVTSRFYLPGAMRQFDPVVTINDRVLRFEGFSSCCGVYARADFNASAFNAELHGRGTTNVDFNSSMRAALACVRELDEVTLSVGADEGRRKGVNFNFMNSYDIYGFAIDDIDAAKCALEECLRTQFSKHNNLAYGTFFRASLEPERLVLHRNWDQESGTPFARYPEDVRIVLHVNGTQRGEEIRTRLERFIQGIRFLKSEVERNQT